MRRIIYAALAVAALSTAPLSTAQAQGGCGPYAHRGFDGWCHPGGGWRGPVRYGYGGWHRPWGAGFYGGGGWHRGPGWRYYHRGW